MPLVRFRLGRLVAPSDPTGPTQAALARQAGLSTQAVNEIVLNKTSRVSLATLGALCGALAALQGRDVGPGELFEYVPDPPRPREPRKGKRVPSTARAK